MFNKHNETKQRFTIKKYTFGVASALVGVFFAGANAQAEEATAPVTSTPVVSAETIASAPVNTSVLVDTAKQPAVESQPVVSPEVKKVAALVEEEKVQATTPAVGPAAPVANSEVKPETDNTTSAPALAPAAPVAESLAEVQGVTAGKVTVDAKVNTVDGAAPASTVNFTINIPQGAYQPGETLTIVSDQIGVFPTMPKELQSNDGIVYATLTTRNLNPVGGQTPKNAATSGTTSLEQKHALNIPAEAPKTEYTYTFNDNIVGLKDTTLSYNFTGNTDFPAVTTDKNVQGKLIVNGVDVAVAPYIAKGQAIQPPSAGGNTTAASRGLISVDETGKNILSRTSNIQFNTGNYTIPQGSRITYTLKETEFSKFVQTGEFKEFSVWAGNQVERQENVNNVILSDSLGSTEVVLKPVSVTDNTLVLEVVKGDLTPGYNISKTLEQGANPGVYGFDRVFSTKTQAFIDEGFPTPNLRYTISSPKGATLTAVGPDGQTITTVNVAPVSWEVRKPSSGAIVTGEPAINGNLVVRYINEANGAILRPSIAVIDTKDPAEISKSKYTSVAPTEDFTKVGTATDPNTPVEITTPDNVKTYTTTVPYVIKTEAGNYYLFTKYTTDNKYYPNSQTAGTVFLNQANLVANYKKAEFGSVSVIYQIEGTNTDLQLPTPTKYDATPNDQFTSLAGKTYDVSDVVAPAELTDPKTGLTYVLSTNKPTNVTGTLTNEETLVVYTYVPKPGKPVTVNYETEDGTQIGTPKEVQADGTQVGTKYSVSADVKLPIIEQDGVKYVLVEAKPLKDGSAEESGKVTDQPQTITYVYQAEQKATVKYVVVDKDGNETKVLETSAAVTGLPGTAITQDTAAKIAEFEAQNYELVEDGFASAADKNFDNKVDAPAVTQEFVVKLREKTVEITDPAQAPAGVTVDALSKTVNQTIKYTLADEKTPVSATEAPDKTDSATFTRKATINLVTGAVTYTDWATTDSTTFEAKPTPVVTGYLAEKATSDEVTGVTETSTDNTQIIKYSPIGKFVVTNPDGSVTETQYKNDPTDPTKVIPTDKPTLPYVEGYTPKDGNGNTLPLVDPNDPTKGYIAPDAPVNGTPDTPIKYAPTDANVNDPKPTTVEVLEDTPLTPADIEKAVPTTGLPAGTKVTVKEPSKVPGTDLPDGTTVTTDKGTVTVVVTYPDGTTDEVEVPVKVIPKDSTKYEPKVNEVIVKEDTPVTEDDIKVAITIPGLDKNTPGLEITVKGNIPGTDLPDGTQVTTDKGTVTVEVKYPDGTVELVEVPVKVIPNDTTKNTPVPTPVEVLEDTPLTPADIEKAVPGLPAGTKVTVKDPSKVPGTDLPDGTTVTTDKGTVTVVVTYPDGTTDEVEVPVKVIPNTATQVTPNVTPVEKVQGTPLTEEDITGAVSGLPNGTKVTVKDPSKIPTTNEPGDKGTVIVEITYPDGSKEEVEVPVNVTPLPVTTDKGTGIQNPEKPELNISVPNLNGELPPVVEEKPELNISVPNLNGELPPVVEEKPELVLPESNKGSENTVTPTTIYVDQDGNVLTPDANGNVPGYELVETKKDANGNTVHVYRKVVKTSDKPATKPAVKATTEKAEAKPAKKAAKAGVLPKTSATTETNSALPAGLAAALAAAGLLATRRRKED